MQIRYFYRAVLAGALFGVALIAQPSPLVSTAVPIQFQQPMTTGVVGVTPNQTARLNVLNLNPVPATANAAPNCNVELQFLDTKNNVLKQNLVMNFAPQTATLLDLTPAPESYAGLTPPRVEIRGAVLVNPPTPAANPVTPGYCGVVLSLEIFDNITGSTVVLTTDARMIGTGGIVPLAVMRHGDFVAAPK
jgi:hypothetical protein